MRGRRSDRGVATEREALEWDLSSNFGTKRLTREQTRDKTFNDSEYLNVQGKTDVSLARRATFGEKTQPGRNKRETLCFNQQKHEISLTKFQVDTTQSFTTECQFQHAKTFGNLRHSISHNKPHRPLFNATAVSGTSLYFA